MSGPGRPRLSDEERKRRGTFNVSRTDAHALERSAKKIITGIFLSRVDDPEMPMGEIGRKKYFEYAEILLNNGKLTKVTRDSVELYATCWEQMHQLKAEGKRVPMALINKMDSIARDLRVAEHAPAIADPTQKKKFSSLGTANNVIHTFRLRSSS